MATPQLEREENMSGDSRGCVAGSEASTRLAPLFDLREQLAEALTRPQLGQAAWLACGWQRLNLRERKTRQERLCWIRGFDASGSLVQLEKNQLGEALTRPQLASWVLG